MTAGFQMFRGIVSLINRTPHIDAMAAAPYQFTPLLRDFSSSHGMSHFQLIFFTYQFYFRFRLKSTKFELSLKYY